MPILTRTNQNAQACESAVLTKPTRRGTTLMEYLMMLSLIIVVALVGIGYFGQQTNILTGASSSAINKSLKKGS